MMKTLSLFMAVLGAALVLNLALAADEPGPLEAEFNRVHAMADAGDTSAMKCLAHMYWFGVGTQVDRSKTSELLHLAAAKGDASAQSSVREVDLQNLGGNPDAAAKLHALEASAGKGDSQDQAVLGSLYYSGYGKLLPQDTAKSFYWFSKAAETGDVNAEIFLAPFYAHGWATPPDPRKAAALLDKVNKEHESCASYYLIQTYGIVFAHTQFPSAVVEGRLQGTVGVRFRFKDGKVFDPKVSYPSGHPELDAAALKAVDDSAFPPPPPVYDSGLAPLDMYINFNPVVADPGYMSGFTGQVRQAIYAAVTLPKDLLIQGTRGSAVTVMRFDYQDGRISNLETATSSGDHELDDAITHAVTSAKLPAVPTKYRGKHLEFWMPFDYTGQLGLLDQDGKPKDSFRTAYINGEYDAFAAALRKTVADKVSYPTAMLGTDPATDQQVGVEFDYLDGTASDIVVTTLSVDDAFKQAATQAVQQAVFPATSQVYAGKSLHMRVILDFVKPAGTTAPTAAPAGRTSVAPAAATQHGH